MMNQCVFEENTSQSGGGFYSREVVAPSLLRLDNLVFAGNTATETGAGMTILGPAGNVEMAGGR